MTDRKKLRHFGILMLFSTVVFLAVLINSVLAAILAYILATNDILMVSNVTARDVGRLVVFYAGMCIPSGLVVAMAVSMVPLKPIRNLINSMDRLASGDFGTRVNVGSVMRRYPPFVEVAESFNKMAQELGNTEMLRSDFINNISHEFKTPIVSIAGFAGLLRKGNLSREQQQEYLTVIEEESQRLSYMATNVLNLTKVENQSILSDVTHYNLSEQIRSCLLLLENKWAKRDLELDLEFAEHTILANEELMRHVWINLLDNAIKFTQDGQTIRVRIREQGNQLLVSVMNTGIEISPEHRKKIFNKFYQADESHSTEGNGVGLAIVKRIVELHGGSISVQSGQAATEFTVELPKEK